MGEEKIDIYYTGMIQLRNINATYPNGTKRLDVGRPEDYIEVVLLKEHNKALTKKNEEIKEEINKIINNITKYGGHSYLEESFIEELGDLKQTLKPKED